MMRMNVFGPRVDAVPDLRERGQGSLESLDVELVPDPDELRSRSLFGAVRCMPSSSMKREFPKVSLAGGDPDAQPVDGRSGSPWRLFCRRSISPAGSAPRAVDQQSQADRPGVSQP